MPLSFIICPWTSPDIPRPYTACLVGRSERQGKHSRRVKRSTAQVECIHYTKMIQNAFHLFCTVPEPGLAADMGPSAITWFIWCNYDAMRVKEVTRTHTHIHTVQSRCYFWISHWISHWIHTVQEDESDLLCLGLTRQSCNILSYVVIFCVYFMILKQLEWRTFWIVWEACRKMEASASEKATALADLEASFCLMNCSGACQYLFGVHRREAKLPNLQSK